MSQAKLVRDKIPQIIRDAGEEDAGEEPNRKPPHIHRIGAGVA
jgi:predicted house-cleaning noncanonical NTP pyrophosphatase (MazG superfamily)